MAINARQQAAVVALASGQAVGAVADLVGVHPKTVSRWRSDPAFVAALRAVQHDALERVLGGLLEQSVAVVGAVGDGLADVDPSVRLRAAGLWLSTVPALVELISFEDRIAKLENRINGENNKP